MKKHIYVCQYLKYIKDILMKYLFFVLGFFFFTQCTIQSKKTISEIAKEIIKNAKNCALITIDSLGVAHARTMDPFLPKKDFTIWMATNPQSLKVQQIKSNPKVTLYYFDPTTMSYVTLQGKALLVNSKEEKNQHWKNEWKNFYKNRDTDYLLIKFTPKDLIVISEKYEILGDSITWKAPNLKL